MIKHSKRGFTIIELSLASVFLAILLITIALIITQIIAIYQKGLATKAVSSTGRELVDDFSRAIAASPTKSTTAICGKFSSTGGANSAKTKCEKDEGFKNIYQQQTGKVIVNGQEKTVPTNGVFCTGRYSYLWNTGYTQNNKLYPQGEQHRGTIVYRLTGTTTEVSKKDYRLLKVYDLNRTACANHVDKGSYTINNNRTFKVGDINEDTGRLGTIEHEPEELLTLSEDNLALYDLKIFPPTQHFLSFHSFYSGTFTLATVPGGVDITGAGDYCKDSPDGLNTDFAYCAINKFNFAMRATGETNEEALKKTPKN